MVVDHFFLEERKGEGGTKPNYSLHFSCETPCLCLCVNQVRFIACDELGYEKLRAAY